MQEQEQSGVVVKHAEADRIYGLKLSNLITGNPHIQPKRDHDKVWNSSTSLTNGDRRLVMNSITLWQTTTEDIVRSWRDVQHHVFNSDKQDESNAWMMRYSREGGITANSVGPNLPKNFPAFPESEPFAT